MDATALQPNYEVVAIVEQRLHIALETLRELRLTSRSNPVQRQLSENPDNATAGTRGSPHEDPNISDLGIPHPSGGDAGAAVQRSDNSGADGTEVESTAERRSNELCRRMEQQLTSALDALRTAPATVLSGARRDGRSTPTNSDEALRHSDSVASASLPRGVDAFGPSHNVSDQSGALSQMQISFLSGMTVEELPNTRDNLAQSGSTSTPNVLTPRATHPPAATGATGRPQRRTTSITYDHVPDGTVADWLNDTFAPTQRQRRRSLATSLSGCPSRLSVSPAPSHSALGMNSLPSTSVIADSFARTPPGTNPLSADGDHPPTNLDAPPASSIVPVPDADLTVSSESAAVKAAQVVRFVRSIDRPIPAVCGTMDTALLLKRCKIPMLTEVDSVDFDIFKVLKERGAEDTFLVVATNVFARYSFMSSLDVDVVRFVAFLRCLFRCYRSENPYHNAIHAADCLQTVHIFLCVNDMRENFADMELCALLFAAVVHDVGHLGVNNAFLTRMRHPVAMVYNGQSVLESAHAASALYLLSLPQYNFFPIPFRQFPPQQATTPCPQTCLSSAEPAPAVTPDMLDDFSSLVIECLFATDMKHHTSQTQIVKGMLDAGTIVDSDCTNVLRSIIHVADISNPMKTYDTYVGWAMRVVAEFWMQGDAEGRAGQPISMMCDRNTTTFGKPQNGFIQFVVKPFAMEMAPIMPSAWLERLQANADRMLNMAPAEELSILAGIAEMIKDRKWEDDVDGGRALRLPDGTPTRLVDILQHLADIDVSKRDRGTSPPPPNAHTATRSDVRNTSEDAPRKPSTTLTTRGTSTTNPPEVQEDRNGSSNNFLPPIRAPQKEASAGPNLKPTPPRRTSGDIANSVSSSGRSSNRQLRDVVPTPQWMSMLSSPRK